MYRVYGCGAGKNSSVLLDLETAARVAVMVWYVQQKGGTTHMTEGYRPVGVEADQYVTDASRTSTGGSNQWFQWGRYQRGLTPSAAWPGTSRHGEGRALDSNAPTAHDMRLRAEGAWLAGLVFNVPSESWHCEPLGTPQTDLTPWYEFVKKGSSSNTKPSTPSNPKMKESPMWLTNTKDTGRIYLFVPSIGFIYIPTVALVGFFRRLIEHHGGNSKEHTFMQHEVDAMNSLIQGAQNKTLSAADVAKSLAPELSKAISGLDIEVKSGASATEIATAVADEIAGRMQK